MDKVAMTATVAASGACRLSPLVQGYWRLRDWQLSSAALLEFIQQHVDLGITSVDHADIYGSYECETLFGAALRLQPALREQLELVSKCGIALTSPRFPARQVKHYDCGAAHIIASVEASLVKLGTDRLDLLLLHRPDLLLDADEVAAAFSTLRQAGKVLHFGVSNFSPDQFDLLQSCLDAPLVTNQVEINPLHEAVFRDGTLEQLQRLHVRPMAWSPMAGGRVFSEQSAAVLRLREALTVVARELAGGNSPAPGLDQVLLAWVRRLPCKPLPVLGSGRLERVRDAVAALDLQLTREQWYRIHIAALGREVA